MYIEPIVLLGFVSVIIVLFGIVVYFVYFQRTQGPKSESKSPESEAIIQSAVEKAQETLLDAQYVKDDLIRDVETSMRSIAESAIVSFQEESAQQHEKFAKLYEEIREKYQAETAKTVRALDENAQEELDKFRRELSQTTIAAEKTASARAQEALNQVKSEIEEYKKAEYARIEEEVRSKAQKILSDLLRKNLSLEDHQRLVNDSITHAKEQGMKLPEKKEKTAHDATK